MQKLSYTTKTWSEHDLHPKEKTQATIDWIFTVDLLNFSFWSEKDGADRYSVRYKDTSFTGYWSLCASINRALEDNIPITTPSYWNSPDFTLAQMQEIFRSNTSEEMPLLYECVYIITWSDVYLEKSDTKC